jgi:DNA-binding LacI/PurR family transcriptional regulator
MAERLGITLPPDRIVRGAYSLESGQAAATRLLAAGVTGIICASDPLALGAIRAARRAGLDVPTDLSVVGYDDSALMNCTDPPLTTVRQPIEAMGRAAIDLLVGQIAGGAVTHDELRFEPELVVRGSTARRNG